MSGMAVVIQAMTWLGLPKPPIWQLILYMLCIGMYGVGVGMLYTPILVDRLQLKFPSGLAVANILRALTDPELLRRSVSRLFGGMALGLAGGSAPSRLPALGAINLSTSTLGAGMIVGARIGLAALLGGLVGLAMMPYFVSIGWLQPGDPFRKITFLIALGMILGAALIDVTLILFARHTSARAGVPPSWWSRRTGNGPDCAAGAVGRVLGHRHRGGGLAVAASAGGVPRVRGPAGVRFRAGQRNIRRA